MVCNRIGYRIWVRFGIRLQTVFSWNRFHSKLVYGTTPPLRTRTGQVDSCASFSAFCFPFRGCVVFVHYVTELIVLRIIYLTCKQQVHTNNKKIRNDKLSNKMNSKILQRKKNCGDTMNAPFVERMTSLARSLDRTGSKWRSCAVNRFWIEPFLIENGL